VRGLFTITSLAIFLSASVASPNLTESRAIKQMKNHNHKRNCAPPRAAAAAAVDAKPESLTAEMVLQIANDDIVRTLQKLAAAITAIAGELI